MTDLIAKLAEIDGFTVDFAGRDEKGNFLLDASVFRVKKAPAPMFGQNVREFGFEQALEIAEKAGAVDEHDFGACFAREKSLRKESDGVWYIDLSVDPHKVRVPQVAVMLVDDEGEPILDENGEVQVEFVPRKESWITVPLSDLEPDFEHPLCAEFRQSDRRTAAQLRANERAQALAEGKSSGNRGRGKGKRKRLSPAEVAALKA